VGNGTSVNLLIFSAGSARAKNQSFYWIKFLHEEAGLITRTRVLSGAYYDSVTLLQVAQGLLKVEGVIDAAAVMGTPANKGILAGADLLTPEAEAAVADDLVLAVRARDDAAAGVALGQADRLLKSSRATAGGGSAAINPKTMAAAMAQLPEANLLLVSVAGRYAAGVAREGLERGLHVFLFSDNVPVEDEIALKSLAKEKGLLMMGPDAGTAILNGMALGFANAVPQGPVGVVAAAGTGLQSVTCALGRMGVGITQAIGTGGRDLSEAVGGVMMLEGLKALQADPATRTILLVSKPPAPTVAAKVLAQLKESSKPTVVCFLGGDPETIQEAGAVAAADLEQAAFMAAAAARGLGVESALEELDRRDAELYALAEELWIRLGEGQKYFRGLFSGGTFCYETQLILRNLIGTVASNAPVDKTMRLADANHSHGHAAVDLGEDEFTVGRLHPMLDPTLRNRRIVQEARDPETAVILLDVVLGFGVHPDPAGAAVTAIREAQAELATAGREVVFLASVCGTEGDPQDVRRQEETLRAAGVTVLPSNAAAARLAGYILSGR